MIKQNIPFFKVKNFLDLFSDLVICLNSNVVGRKISSLQWFTVIHVVTAKLHVTEKMMHHFLSWASKNMDAGHGHGQFDKKKIKDERVRFHHKLWRFWFFKIHF